MGSRKNRSTNDKIVTDLSKGISKDGAPFIRASVITTPIKAKERDVSDCDNDNNSKDETPIKNSLPIKRRSLMCDMNWFEDAAGQNSTKHSMEMRSRKCSKFKEYYDYQEYDDFAEDLSFLFDEQISDLECRSRRKPKKKRSSLSTNSDSKVHLKSNHSASSTSRITKDANHSTSSFLSETSLFTKPNLKRASPSDLENLNIKSVSCSRKSVGTPRFEDSSASSKTVPDSNQDKCRKNDSHDAKIRPQKRKISSAIEDNGAKWQTSEIQSKNFIKPPKRSILDKKVLPKNGKILRLSCDVDCGRKSQLKLNCAAKKMGARNTPTMPNPTVIKMTLRRRHSTPSLGGNIFKEESKDKLERTVSIPAGTGEEEPAKKEKKYPKLDSRDSSIEWTDYSDDISDLEQFVDSPESTDSGFSSETSCSAVTPDGEPRDSLNFDPTKTCEEPRICISQTSSKDAQRLKLLEPANKEANNLPKDGELRLVLCQKSIQEAQKLEIEAKKKKEETELREKYQCLWTDCSNPFESRSSAELHSHLEKFHAENYCCQWKGCKFFDIQSRKLTFLQRHIGDHSGEKPYKCILDGCDASFSSLRSRKRHVEAHYSEVSYPKAKVGGENAFSRFLLNSRRVKDKRKTLANRHDCMDNRTLAFVKHALIQNEVALATDDDVISNPSEVTFRPEVISKKVTKDGRKHFLVKWKPESLLPNEWIMESEMTTEKIMKMAELARNADTPLRRHFFFRRNLPGRKATQKPSMLETLF